MSTWAWEVYDPETEEIVESGETFADSEDEAVANVHADYQPDLDGKELRLVEFQEEDDSE
jgi:hypothetical protein